MGGGGISGHIGASTSYGQATPNHGGNSTSRTISIGDDTYFAESTPGYSTVGLHCRLSHQLPLGDDIYVRPILDLDATRLSASGYTETGAGDFDLELAH